MFFIKPDGNVDYAFTFFFDSALLVKDERKYKLLAGCPDSWGRCLEYLFIDELGLCRTCPVFIPLDALDAGIEELGLTPLRKLLYLAEPTDDIGKNFLQLIIKKATKKKIKSKKHNRRRQKQKVEFNHMWRKDIQEKIYV